jgi:hypothetical protein
VDLGNWIELASTVFAAAAAGISLWSVCLMRKQAQGQIMWSCLQQYTDIKGRLDDAVAKGDVPKVKAGYREIFDMQWAERNCYLKDLLPRDVFLTWLESRHRSYETDKIEVAGVLVSYKEVWDDLVKKEYWAKDDPFLEFMALVHQKKFEEALRVK